MTLSSTAIVLLAVAVVFGELSLGGGTRGAMLVIVLAVASTALPITLFLVGIRHVGAGRAAIISTIEPVVTVVSAAVVLGERVGLLQGIGGALILTAILWLRSERPVPPGEIPTPLEVGI